MGLGHQAVMIFFVLSGFFVGGAVMKNPHSFDLKKYALARLTRLWVVLIPALLITAIIDHFIGTYAPQVFAGFYKNLWNSGPLPGEAYSSTLLTFLGNIFFLQTTIVPVFGTNGPLWSLANEFWYYVIFPLCMMVVTGRFSLISKILIGLAILASIGFLPLGIQYGYMIWLMGLITFYGVGKTSLPRARILSAVGLALLILSLVYSKLKMAGYHDAIYSDILIGAAFCVLSVGLVNGVEISEKYLRFSRFSKLISDFSYSLYLIHFPIVIWLGSLFYKSGKLNPDINGFAHFGGWLAVLLACGLLFWWIFENRTPQVRRFLAARMFK